MANRPSIREAHAHLPWLGRALSMPDLSACAHLADVLDALARHAQTLPANAWVQAAGARRTAWPEQRWPTPAEIDAAVAGRPAMIMSFDHHAVACGSAALCSLNIDAHTPDPLGGVIVRSVDGTPTGELLESAAWSAWSKPPEPVGPERRTQVLHAAEHLAALGYAEMHDLFSGAWLADDLAASFDQHRLPLHVAMFAPMDELDAHLAIRERTRRRGDHASVSLLGGKIFADGTLNSRTAWMLHDFADPLPDLPRGKSLMSADQIAAALSRCAHHGLLLAAHAIGDAAVRACLDAAEQTRLGRHLRIEHAEIVDAADVPRFAALGVTLSVQPCHLLADIEALRRSLPHRLGRVLPLRDLIDSGLVPGHTLLFGSDAPVVGADPRNSIQAATQRRRATMPATDSIAPEQAISEHEAWRCFECADAPEFHAASD